MRITVVGNEGGIEEEGKKIARRDEDGKERKMLVERRGRCWWEVWWLNRFKVTDRNSRPAGRNHR